MGWRRGIASRLLAEAQHRFGSNLLFEKPLWMPIIHQCWSGSMSALVEGAAESVLSADIEVRDPLRIGDRFG